MSAVGGEPQKHGDGYAYYLILILYTKYKHLQEKQVRVRVRTVIGMQSQSSGSMRATTRYACRGASEESTTVTPSHAVSGKSTAHTQVRRHTYVKSVA